MNKKHDEKSTIRNWKGTTGFLWFDFKWKKKSLEDYFVIRLSVCNDKCVFWKTTLYVHILVAFFMYNYKKALTQTNSKYSNMITNIH